MSVIKETLKFNNLDLNLKFSLGSNVGLTGYQQEIDNSTIDTEDELINPVNDTEVRRFKNSVQNNLSFYFVVNNTNNSLFRNAGFTQDEIDFNRDTIRNSFFILDFYDTYDTNTQTKIFTTYLTKILGNGNTANYVLDITNHSNQFSYWYIPQSYINLHTTGYVKFSFFNAKYGVIQLFYNLDNQALKTPEKLYFKAALNLTTMTWSLTLAYPPNINAVELYGSSYASKINNALSDFNNMKQNYPTGNAFDSTNGTYTAE